MILMGGCRCGLVRYRVTGPAKFSFACHCTDCQQLTSSAYSLGLVLAESHFAVDQGEPRVWTKQAEGGKPSHMYTCPTCAGWTHTRPESVDGLVVVRPTTLDEPRWFRPIAEIWTRSALPWARMPVPFSIDGEFEETKPLIEAFAASGMMPG